MRKQLDQISLQMPLLVASCTGGLVPYENMSQQGAGFLFLDNRKRSLRLPDFESRGSGE
jgi:hypothetical protein